VKTSKTLPSDPPAEVSGAPSVAALPKADLQMYRHARHTLSIPTG